MEDLEIECASDSRDGLKCCTVGDRAYLAVSASDGDYLDVCLFPETAQELIDWLTKWIEQSALICGWARVEEQSGGWRVFRASNDYVLASFASRALAVAWVEALTAEVRK